MATIPETQAALAVAQADLATLTTDVNAASASAAMLLTDLDRIATDLASLVPTPPPSGMPAPPGYKTLVLDDTFANLNNWNTFYGPGVRWDNHGQLKAPYSGANMPGANDVALYNPSQIVLSNGVTLNAVPAQVNPYSSMGYTWLSGCLTTKNPLPSTGWYVQIKAKRPDTAHGMWPADWFLPADDVQELDGYEGGWPGSNPNQQGHSDTFAASGQVQNVWNTGVDMSAGFHVYGYQYLPGVAGSFSVFFDGIRVYRFLGNLSQQAYYLFLQLQVAAPSTKGWHTVGGTTPGTMTVQEVQVWTP